MNTKKKDIDNFIKEFTSEYIQKNNINNNLFKFIYNNIKGNINALLDKNSPYFNEHLFNEIKNNKINYIELLRLLPSKQNPRLWADIITKIQNENIIKTQNLISTMYKCKKCNSNKCMVTQLQTRSADEPTTTFISCMVCYNTFKK